MNKLDFKTYMLASDGPENAQCSVLRRSEDWYRLYEIANEMVEKYGLDGSGIPLGAKVISADRCDIQSANYPYGYKGIDGVELGVFRGPVNDEKWKDYYFSVQNETKNKWFYRPCWWRFLIILP